MKTVTSVITLQLYPLALWGIFVFKIPSHATKTIHLASKMKFKPWKLKIFLVQSIICSFLKGVMLMYNHLSIYAFSSTKGFELLYSAKGFGKLQGPSLASPRQIEIINCIAWAYLLFAALKNNPPVLLKVNSNNIPCATTLAAASHILVPRLMKL